MESAVSCDLIQNDRGAPMSPCTCHDLPLPFPGSLRPISCHNNAGGDVLETAMEAIGSLHTISPVMTSPRDAGPSLGLSHGDPSLSHSPIIPDGRDCRSCALRTTTDNER